VLQGSQWRVLAVATMSSECKACVAREGRVPGKTTCSAPSHFVPKPTLNAPPHTPLFPPAACGRGLWLWRMSYLCLKGAGASR
jgi:hypothetical protein